jgi:hypothetical protein
VDNRFLCPKEETQFDSVREQSGMENNWIRRRKQEEHGENYITVDFKVCTLWQYF